MASFFHALKWSVAAEIASRAFQPLVFVILARLLTPDAYGVMAAAVMVISFTQVFWEAGMSKALIQRSSEVEASANVAFWVNIALGALIAAILFLFADQIAEDFFQDDRVADVLRFMTLQIFLGAFSSIHTALLQKDMKFNQLFWVRLATIAVPGFFSIPLAWYGWSYWALVAGTLVGQAAQVIVLWRISPWRPRITFDSRLAKELLRFGSWVGITGFLSWFYIWMDSLFVGRYLGTHELGLYRTGNQFVSMIFGFLFAPLLPVLYSHLSKRLGDIHKLRDDFMKVVRIVTFISIPTAFLMYALSDNVASIFFGTKWHGIDFVMGVMALMHGYSWVVGANGEIYRAIGKPSLETVVMSLSLGFYLVGYYISIKQGIEIFIWTRFVLALGAMGLHIWFARMAIHISIFPMLKIIFLATLIGIVPMVLRIPISKITQNAWVMIGAITVISGLIMAGLLILFQRNGAIQDLATFWNKRKAV